MPQTWPHTNEMKSTARFPSKKAKSYRERIPLDEIQRLMHVYGSTKCLRMRALPGGGTDAKAESIKRKFWRWFPDLDERFEKVEGTGRYVPKAGHEAEVRYREEMRAKDGEALAKKRMRKRAETRKKESASYVKKIMERNRERRAEEMKKISRYMKKKNGEMAVNPSEANAECKAAPFFPTTVSPDNSKLAFSSVDAEEEERKALVSAIQMEAGPSLKTGAMEEEPLEDSFIAEGWKCDNVEENFFRPSPSPGDVAARQYRAPLLPGKGTGLERLDLLVRIMGDGPHVLQQHCGQNDGGDSSKGSSPPPYPAGQRTTNGASLFSQT